MFQKLCEWTAVLGLLALGGCGGNGGSWPVVMDVQADRLMYSQTSQFTLIGQSLDMDFSVSARNCKGLVLVPGGTAMSKTVSCTINATGAAAVGIEATLADGTVLLTKTFDVPAPQVTLSTSLGTMVVELNPAVVPLTVNNFLQYVNDRFYDGTLFHRIYSAGISVVQGGWLTAVPAVQTGLRAPIALEVGKGLSNLRGTIGMARSNQLDTATATSQFYFNVTDNVALDTANGGYAVFGRLVSGLDVMDAISRVPTTTQYGLSNFPTSSIVITSAAQTR